MFNYTEFEKAVEKYKLRQDEFVMQWIENNPAEVNFCGSKKGMKVPDTMYGLFIGWACCIHDGRFGLAAEKYEYLISINTLPDIALKVLTDDVFQANIEMFVNTFLIIWRESNGFMVVLRSLRSLWYFLAVMWKGKDTLLTQINRKH